ncbi:MAG TPA: hypothetical protein VF756_24090 [Thermoanaerobaculia bacterium]
MILGRRLSIFVCTLALIPAAQTLAQEPRAGATCADPGTLAGKMTVAGAHAYVAGTLFVPPKVRLEVASVVGEDGVVRWRPVIDGKEVDDPAAMAWKAGRYEVGAAAVNRCGDLVPVEPLAFTVDAEAPTLTPEIVDDDALADRSLKKRKDARRNAVLWSGGAQWFPLPSEGATVRIASDQAQVFFYAPDATVSLDGRDEGLEKDRMLRIRAEDAESRVEHLTFRTRRESGGIVLAVETADLVGNVRKGEWVLETGQDSRGKR